jgi:hypothetical protein
LEKGKQNIEGTIGRVLKREIKMERQRERKR